MIRKIFDIILFISIFIVVIEFAARIDDKITYGAPFFEPYAYTRMHTKDEEGILHNIPNSRFEKWEINGLGFRGNDISPTKNNGVIRIAFMGASETFGLYESPGYEWPAQLSRILSPLKNYEVVNTSVVGLGKLSNYQKYIDKYVLRINPNIVILYLYNNFDLSEGFPNKAGKKEGRTKKANTISLSIHLKKLRSLRKMKLLVKKHMPEKGMELFQAWDIKRTEKKILELRQPLDNVPDEAALKFRSDLESIVTMLQNNNVKVILCTVPDLISHDNLEDYRMIVLAQRKYKIMFSEKGLVNASIRANKIIKDVAQSTGADFIDLYNIIPKSTDIFVDNLHYTNEGAKLVAETIGAHIVTHPISTQD